MYPNRAVLMHWTLDSLCRLLRPCCLQPFAWVHGSQGGWWWAEGSSDTVVPLTRSHAQPMLRRQDSQHTSDSTKTQDSLLTASRPPSRRSPSPHSHVASSSPRREPYSTPDILPLPHLQAPGGTYQRCLSFPSHRHYSHRDAFLDDDRCAIIPNYRRIWRCLPDLSNFPLDTNEHSLILENSNYIIQLITNLLKAF